jgi:anaerobic magnesium-protoporphyrin IX monomethyl ester cyclase
MRLLLVNVGRNTEIRLPQGLLYLASAVGYTGHEVSIHDEALESSQEESLKKILYQEADVIGLSVYSVPWQLKRMEDISAAIKAHRKSTIVVWGGWHPTLYPKHTILNENVDVVVCGPGEKPLCEMLNAIEKGRDLHDIFGLVIKNKEGVVETGPVCLDPHYLYPRLNFDHIELQTYLDLHDRGNGILQYITSRGCHASCRFCIMSRQFKRRLIRKPRDQMLEELEMLLAKHEITTLHFSDDNTFRNDSEALELCDIVKSLTNGNGIPWRCATRIDTLSCLSNQTLRKMADSGCKGVVVGIESGCDRVLKLMNKAITVSQTRKALAALLQNGLSENLFSFLLGFTGESLKESRETLKFARNTRLMFPDSDITLHVYFPGASNLDWLETDIDKSSASQLSDLFEDYYDNHITNYRVGWTNIKVLRYYFGTSRRKNNSIGRFAFLRNLFRQIKRVRIKYGIFILTFEYYFSRLRSRTGK